MTRTLPTPLRGASTGYVAAARWVTPPPRHAPRRVLEWVAGTRTALGDFTDQRRRFHGDGQVAKTRVGLFRAEAIARASLSLAATGSSAVREGERGNMSVIANDSRQVFEIPGIRHQTLASQADGLERLEIWMQTLAPGAETPMHYHECEEAVVVQRGSGCAVIADKTVPFGPGTTLVIAPKVEHKIVNGGEEEMFLVAALSESPARVFAPDGTEMDLPW